MKNNPLTDLVFEQKHLSRNVDVIFEARLIHKDLPFKIVRRCEYVDKYVRSFPDKVEEGINKTIYRLFLDVQQMADNNVSTKPMGGVFIPEWDKDRLQWFVLNYEGERLYTYENFTTKRFLGS